MCRTGLDCCFRFVPLDVDAVDGLERVHDGGECQESFGQQMISCVFSIRVGSSYVVLHQLVRSASFVHFVYLLSLRLRLLHSTDRSLRRQHADDARTEADARQD